MKEVENRNEQLVILFERHEQHNITDFIFKGDFGNLLSVHNREIVFKNKYVRPQCPHFPQTIRPVPGLLYNRETGF